jgi:prefoldin subunit 5
MKNDTINWDNINNSSIKLRLEELKHERNSLKEKILKLADKLEDIEKEYYYGNKILTKRYKGEE